MRLATRGLPLVAVAIAIAGCGYGFSERYVARGGASSIRVRTFENRSSEPGLGAAVTEALRTELSRRGADGASGAAAEIDGEVVATEPAVASSGAATWRVALTVHARLSVGGAKVAEHVASRDTQFLGGSDPLETEGRRALALRRLADDTAREVLRAFER